MRIESAILIKADADTVFRFISAPENETRWQEGAVWTRVTTPGPVGLGSEMDHVGRWLGMSMRTHAVVTVFDPGSAFGYDISTSLSETPSRMRYSLDRMPDGTKLTLSNTADLPRFAQPFAPLLRRSVQRMFDRDVARLRAAIEAEQAAATGRVLG